MKKLLSMISAILIALLLFSCTNKNEKSVSVAVFIPGIMADSPIYAMLAEGVQNSIDSYNANKSENEKATITILEAGTNQAEWGEKITALTAEEKYDVIISSNPSLPELVEPLTQQFPKQKYILLDAKLSGNNNIATVQYNQHEQSYITGYMAGLKTTSKKLGLISAQEYPIMNDVILPGFIEGAKAANPDITVDFRIVGNWYDATKGAELANALYKSGVDIILPICGGASQGVINSAKEHGKYLVFFDGADFSRARDNIISCTKIDQTKMAEDITTSYLNGNVEWGNAKTVGVSDEFIYFVLDDENYENKNVDNNMREKMTAIIDNIKSGTLSLLQD